MTQLQLFAKIFLWGFGAFVVGLAFIVIFGRIVYNATKKKLVNLESAGIYDSKGRIDKKDYTRGGKVA
jgi:hypothetical protein